jgi:hypothetical protein
MTRRSRPRLALVKPSPVLITESVDEFSRLHDALKDEFKPHGTVEQFKVEEIAALMWEIRRYRRAKTAILNSAYRDALGNLLGGICREPGPFVLGIGDKDELVHQWFGDDQNAKQLVLQKLAYFGLDERAIEAQAMQIRAADLEKLDRLLASREWRLDKAWLSFAEFRGGLGRHLRETAERVIDGKVLAVGDASKNPPPAAA